jgi:uncharacterized membrane protein
VYQDPSESSFGLAPNIAAGIAAFFGAIGSLIILLGKPPQQWVRFVAVQSIVLFVGYFVLQIALSVLSGMLAVAHLGLLILPVYALNGLLGLVLFIAWIVVTVRAFQGTAVRLPVVAEYADKWSAASTAL